MLPREIFEILHVVMAILVLFQHFSGKLCLNFLTLNLSTFCSHILWCILFFFILISFFFILIFFIFISFFFSFCSAFFPNMVHFVRTYSIVCV